MSLSSDMPADDQAELDSAHEAAATEFFEPQSCNSLLPVGRISQRSVYWRLNVLDFEIPMDILIDEDQPPDKQVKPGTHRGRMGLPLGLVAPAWAAAIPVRHIPVDGETFTVGADGVFLPSAKATDFVRSEEKEFPVDNLDLLEAGKFPYSHRALRSSVSEAATEDADSEWEHDALDVKPESHESTTLKVSNRSMSVLLEHGRAYAREIAADGTERGLVLVSLLANVAHVAVEAISETGEVAVTLDKKAHLVTLTASQRDTLRKGHPITVRQGPDALLIIPRISGQNLSAMP